MPQIFEASCQATVEIFHAETGWSDFTYTVNHKSHIVKLKLISLESSYNNETCLMLSLKNLFTANRWEVKSCNFQVAT